MAVRIRFSMIPPKIREGIDLNCRKWKTPNSIPISPKARPIPPSTKATG